MLRGVLAVIMSSQKKFTAQSFRKVEPQRPTLVEQIFLFIDEAENIDQLAQEGTWTIKASLEKIIESQDRQKSDADQGFLAVAVRVVKLTDRVAKIKSRCDRRKIRHQTREDAEDRMTYVCLVLTR